MPINRLNLRLLPMRLAKTKRGLVFLIFTEVLNACTYTVSPTPQLPQPLFQRHPSSIHLFLSSDLKHTTVSPRTVMRSN